MLTINTNILKPALHRFLRFMFMIIFFGWWIRFGLPINNLTNLCNTLGRAFRKTKHEGLKLCIPEFLLRAALSTVMQPAARVTQPCRFNFNLSVFVALVHNTCIKLAPSHFLPCSLSPIEVSQYYDFFFFLWVLIF